MKNNIEININTQSDELFGKISSLIDSVKRKIAISVNSELALLYWHIGSQINEFVLNNERAPYGKQIIKKLSQKLTEKYGSGWGDKHIRHCLRIAETFLENQIVYALSRQLNWTHIRLLSYENETIKRQFYLEMCALHKWNTRTLEEQMDKMLYERTAIAQKPEEQIKQALQELSETNTINPDLVFKSSYFLDFLGLKNTYSEKDIEDAIVINLQNFILELGNGFAFLERQKCIQIDAIDYHLDLLFYHRKLKRLIAIDIKLGKFKPQYKGQMELYLKWLQINEMQEGENLPIGLLLCGKGNTEHIEIMMLNEPEIKVAQFFTELPSKEWFIEKLHIAIELSENYSKKIK